MANKTLPQLDAGTAITKNDLFLSRQDGQTADSKVTGEQLSAFAASNAPAVKGNRVAAIGTSLVQQCAEGSLPSNRVSYSSRGWLYHALVNSDRRIESPLWFDAASVPGW